MKKCCKCGEVKSLIDFTKDKHQTDGLDKKCRQCKQEYRDSHRAEIRARDIAYYHDKKENILEKKKIRRRDNPQKAKAQRSLGYAVERGKIIKPDLCELCNKPKLLDGHHEDYSDIYDVWFLCRSCHKKIHAIDKEININ